jgi:hypothetical protein
MIETYIESALATVSKRFAVANHFLFLLLTTYRSCVHIIKLPNRLSKTTILKNIMLIVFGTRSEFEPSKNLISGNPLKVRTSSIFQIAITIAIVIKIMYMSRPRKDEQASCKIHNQASSRFTHFGLIELGFHPNV